MAKHRVRGASSIRGFDPWSLPIEPERESLPRLSAHSLTAAGLRARFALRQCEWSPELSDDRLTPSEAPGKPAAVLIALSDSSQGLSVLLTVRPSHLRSHSGQIALPGGRAERSDADRIATALREAHEEVALPSESLDVLGELPEYQTGSGFAVTPIVALVTGRPSLLADPDEVEEIFHTPLSYLMDPGNHQRRRLVMSGIDREFYAMPWQKEVGADEYFIWGVTAAILRNLYHFLRADQEPAA